MVVDEHIDGVSAVAAPFFDAATGHVNTISVAGPSARIDAQTIWPILKQTVDELAGS
jgi:DNA-binding IclR family transcriptional regulator